MVRADLRSWLVRAGILAVAVLLTWGALLVGRLTEPIQLEAEARAPQTFYAPSFIRVTDEEETALARQRARLNVETQYATVPDIGAAVVREISGFFARVRELSEPVVAEEPVEEDSTTSPEATETTAASEGSETTTTMPTTTTIPEPLPIEEQMARLAAEYGTYESESISIMVQVANAPEVGSRNLEELRNEAVAVAERLLAGGIRSGELADVRSGLLAQPPYVLTPLDLPVEQEAARTAVLDIVSQSLQANEVRDDQATEAARRAAEEAVEPITFEWRFGEVIVSEGEPVSTVELEALQQGDLLRGPGGLSAPAMLAMVTVLMAVLGFYLARFRPDFWVQPKRVALFGLLIFLAALATRGVALLLIPVSVSLGYLVPAAAFGFMTAILFDARMAVLTAVAVGALTGLATFDPDMVTGSLGYTLFALLATLIPVPFVSAISARADLRRAVGYSGLAMAPMAGAIAWLFHGQNVAFEAVGWGLVNALVSGFVAMGLLPFLETLFDTTTALTLLDLTDRNHPALQLLEERALGTFNHSLMVGNLADRGARAIGANPLLARAAAYYHDLGKTENPWFFIENQFGGTNPHDSMPPEESSEIVRQHVVDGQRLAQDYRIPTEVAEGVLAHHGTGLMRFFYQKAVERYGDDGVDPARFRHRGHKPRAKEMTILMLADAVEGACRALVLHEEPTPDNIRRTIDRVVAEKQTDGQLDESALTLGELREVKEAFAGALLGHYHQRIPYPNFPESPEDAIAWVGESTHEAAPRTIRLEQSQEPVADVGRSSFDPRRWWSTPPGIDLPALAVVGGLVLVVTAWVAFSIL